MSLYPSVGNWSFPCKSHYWIEHSHVRWARAMPQWRIDQVRRLDQAAEAPVTSIERRSGWWLRLARWFLGR